MSKRIRTDIPLTKNRDKMNQIIAKFWNRTSAGWLKISGPHIHHGYYETTATTPTSIEAQEILINKLATELDLPTHATILDVGCGMGGSSCYLAENYQARVEGITLSTKQINIAKQIAEQKKLEYVNFTLEDALSLKSFPHGTFDIVWSLESCEQFIDKRLFLEKAFAKLKSGGKLLLATWCSGADEYSDRDARSYQKLCHAFDLPYMPTLKHYEHLLYQQGYRLEKSYDWTDQVKQTWYVGLNLIKPYSIFTLLKLGGFRGLRFARQLLLMKEAFNSNRVRYGVLIAVKP